jgi:hypothetical protein
MENILDSAKEKLTEITGTITGISENITSLLKKEVIDNLKDYGIEKVNDAWTQIESSTEVFARTGYSITAININVAIPPTITLSLDQTENNTDEEEEKLLNENKDKTFVYSILVALFKANAIQKSINSVQYKFSGLSIGLGLSPSIDMKFGKV